MTRRCLPLATAIVSLSAWMFLVLVGMVVVSLSGTPGRVGSAAAQHSSEELAHPPGYMADEILVKFFDGTPRAAMLNAVARLGARELKAFPAIGVRLWRLGRGLSVEQALEILSAPDFAAHIEYAEPNFLLHAHDIPNDSLRGELWGLHNLGQTGGLKDADIDALEAWQVQTGSANVVGVIDTGIDYTHPDLAANIWSNPGEANCTNNTDDDGNGYIDDCRGWDFVNNDNDPMDDNSHGSHTAGTIGAAGNNSIGVVGVNWTVKLMPLKFLNASGSGTTADAVEAILYAASFQDGAGNKVVRITNNSWGGGNQSKTLKDAIASSGALFVASAGNNGSSTKLYPAGYDLDNIVSVAATDHNDLIAHFSNFSSTWVDLGAPGVDILSSTPNASYGLKSGTSMAAPHVAGAAALVMAQFPSLTVLQVKSKILETVDRNASLQGKTVTGGRLNVARAVGASELPPDGLAPEAVTTLGAKSSETTARSVTLFWNATGDDGIAGNAYLYDVRYRAGEAITEANWDSSTPARSEPAPGLPGTVETFTVTGLLPGTTYYFALKVGDEVGNFSALSNVVQENTLASLWTAEVVDSPGDVGFYNALAFDPSGNPSIGYSDSTNGTLKFARSNGASWTLQTVDSGGRGTDVAYDPVTGQPCLTNAPGALKFACWNGSSWTIQTLERSGAYNDVTSLAFDPNGNPTISYGKWKGATGLKFARRSGSTWTTQTVEAGAGARYSSLAYDAPGNPSIAYSDDIDKDGWLDTLKFARWDPTTATWNIQIVETGVVGYGVFCSLAYDAIGNPTIVHRTGGNVRFVRWNGSQWQVEIVDSGTYTSLAYDSTGAPVISYLYGNASEVRVARWNGSAWDIEVADNVSINWRTSVKVNPTNNKLSVSYGESSNADLKYAHRQ